MLVGVHKQHSWCCTGSVDSTKFANCFHTAKFRVLFIVICFSHYEEGQGVIFMCSGAHYGEVQGVVSVERWFCSRGGSCVVEYTMGKFREWSL